MFARLSAGRFRLLSLPALALVAVLLGGADGCSGSAGLAGARTAIAAEDYDGALASINTALTANPNDVDALTLKAEVLRLQLGGAPDAAAKTALITEMNATVRRALALDSTSANAAAIRTNAWMASVNQGVALLRDPASPPGSAIPLFTAAAELLPDSTQGHFYLGLAEFSAGNATAAIAPLRTAMRLDPTDAQAPLYLGRVLIQAEQGDAGIAVLTDAAARFPASAQIRAELLNAYQRTGRSAEAITLYESAIAAATPADEPVLRFNYGTVLLQAGRTDEAVAQFERAIELDPANFDAQYNLGAAYQNQAAAANRRANETTDNTENRRLVAERDALLNRSLPYFETARTLGAEGADRTSACTALFRVYTTLGRIDDARTVAGCAGISMN